MKIWKKDISLDTLNEMGKDTALVSLGIKMTKLTDDTLEGEMPVDSRTRQIYGILHGGSSVLFAETLGSVAGLLAAKEGFVTVGLDINANHLRAVKDGDVVGVASAIHLGRTTQVWEIKISHKQTKKLVCISRLTLAVIKEPSED